MRGRLLVWGLLLLAGPAEAHFHERLEAESHAMRFRWDAGTLLADEAFVVRNVGTDPFGGRVYAWLPASAQVTLFGPEGGAPMDSGSGLLGYDLGAHGLTLQPNATLAFNLTWSAPLGPGQVGERRIAYNTTGLDIGVEPPVLLAERPSGRAGFADVVRVALPPPPGLEGWQVLAGFTALLLAGAWLWDRRRKGAKP